MNMATLNQFTVNEIAELVLQNRPPLNKEDWNEETFNHLTDAYAELRAVTTLEEVYNWMDNMGYDDPPSYILNLLVKQK